MKITKTLNLRLYFTILSLTSIIIVTVGASWYFARLTNDFLLALGKEEAQQIANYLSTQLSTDVLTPAFSGNINPESDPEQYERISQTILRAMGGLDIIRTDLHSPDGVLIFSTQENFTDGGYTSQDIIEAARLGQPISHIEPSGELDPLSNEAWQVDILETSIPYRLSGNGEVIGVFEIYQNIDPLKAQIVAMQKRIIFALVVFMGVLFLGLYAFIWHADRLITNQQDTLETQNATLMQLQQTKDELTHMLVHDLKQPLTGIQASISLLQQFIPPNLDKKIIQVINRAQNSSQNLLKMINQLLDITRLREGKFPLNKQFVPVHAFIDLPLELATVQAQINEQRIVDERDVATLPIQVNADIELLQRVMSNLLSNAEKYTPNGGQITVMVGKMGLDQLQVAVIDQGPGIPPAWRDHIFDRFAQVQGSDNRPNVSGTGLGLTFCRMAINAHSGHIWVEDAPDGGSRFVFTLPLLDS